MQIPVLNITLLMSCVALLMTAATADASTENADVFASTATARDLAIAANAPGIAEKEWQSAEKVWERSQKARDKGKQEDASEKAIEAQQLFAAAELQAIQNGLLLDARAAIATAERNKAKRYAPQTLTRARELASEAERLLAADRYAIDDAAAVADQAIATAIHAEQITAIARNKPATENLILQWEGYLARLQTAAGVTASVDTQTRVAIEELETEIARLQRSEQQLLRDLADSRAFGAALEEEIRELDQRLGGASTERQQLVMRLEEQARAREQLAQAEGLFNSDEALVFRQSNDIVVRVIGLQFASGSAKLGNSNEALLKKLEQAIAIYPRSMLVIEGHTDSRGSDRINKRLSEQRAQAVANHIITKMRIPAHRLTAVGYGAAKPIANNETAEGRAQNRRIDLLITPENGVPF
jgi:OOP family OmpA-OmpF porin